MNWRSVFDSLKQRASAQTRSTTSVARKLLDAMGTNIPDVRTGKVTEDVVESSAKSLGIDPLPPAVTTHGWLLSLSRVATTEGGHVWHLSASLHPRGRSSTVNDWKMRGHLVMHLGALKDPTIMSEDPTRVVHWRWQEAS